MHGKKCVMKKKKVMWDDCHIHVNLELTSFIPFHGTMVDLFEKIGVATKEMEEIQLFHMKSNEATPGYTISKANDYKSSCLQMYETLTHLFLNKLPSQEYNTFASKLIECFYKFEHIASFNLTLKRLASLLHSRPENTLELENGLLENIRNVLHGRIEFYCFLIKWCLVFLEILNHYKLISQVV